MNTETIFVLVLVLVSLVMGLYKKRHFIVDQIKMLWYMSEAQAGVHNGRRIKYRLEKTDK